MEIKASPMYKRSKPKQVEVCFYICFDFKALHAHYSGEDASVK